MGRQRDRLVYCWCFRRCAKDGNKPIVRSARSRDQHVADDLDDLNYAQANGHIVSPGLSRALRRAERQRKLEAEASAEQVAEQQQPLSDGADLRGGHSDGDDDAEDPEHMEMDWRMEEDELERYGAARTSSLPASALQGCFLSPFDIGEPFPPGDWPGGFFGPPSADGSSSHAAGEGSAAQAPSHQDLGKEDEEQELPRGEDRLAAETLLFFGAEEGDGETEDEEEGDNEARDSSSQARGRLDQHIRQSGSPDNDADSGEREAPRSTHCQQTLDQLLNGYTPGPKPTESGGQVRLDDLSESQMASLRHLKTWIDTNGPQKVYDGFAVNAKVLRPDLDIMERRRAARLVKTVTGLEEERWDMCVNSCRAFVGPHAHLESCDFERDGVPCGEPRYDRNRKPRRQFVTLPVRARIQAQLRAGDSPTHLHNRAEQAAQTFEKPYHVFQDWADGEGHRHLVHSGLFDDPRNHAFMLSTDGAQMLNRRKSEAWIVLLTSLNFPLETRFKRKTTFVSTIIPGPNPPGDIESFLWPIMEDLARAAVGFWMWDALRQEWFLWRAWLVAACADLPGSTKINGMVGHQGYCGCKTCLIKANYLTSGQVVGYFPLKTVGRDASSTHGRRKTQRNLDRPDYSPYHLPLRSDATLTQALEEVLQARANAESGAVLRQIQRNSGIMRAPLLAASPAFIHPSFFPPDCFHLFGTNIPTMLWNVFHEGNEEDPFFFSEDQRTRFGELVVAANKDLPPSFAASQPRNPDTFSESY